MASPNEPADQQAIESLEHLAAALEDELAAWRRRSMKAEAEVEEQKNRTAPGGDLSVARQRITELETENQRLRARIATARDQVEQLRTRLRFVEEQVTGERA